MRLHAELGPYPHRRQRCGRLPRRPGRGDAGTARRAVLHASDEVHHVRGAGVVDDHDVIALQGVDRDQSGVRAVPRILVVQRHRPAAQGLELGHALVAVEDVLQAEPGMVRLVRSEPVHELRAGGAGLGDRRLDRRQVGRMVPLVAKDVEEHAVQVVLDLGRPRRGQLPVAGLDGRHLAFAVLPRGQRRNEDVVAPPGHVPPAGRPLLVHRDHVAVHPEQVQSQVAQQLVAIGVAARFGPRRDLRTGRRLGLEVAPHDGGEVIDGVDGREVRLGKEVGREDEAAVRVHDEWLHLVSISGARARFPPRRRGSTGRVEAGPTQRRRAGDSEPSGWRRPASEPAFLSHPA